MTGRLTYLPDVAKARQLSPTAPILFGLALVILLVAPQVSAQLVASPSSENSVSLVWTATGDDGATGNASQYDIRYSTAAITDANWTSATQAVGEPAPHAPGTQESFTVAGLQPATTYYFAVKVADEVPNWSPLSNIAVATTDASGPAPDTTEPSDIASLAVTTAARTSLSLSWTSPGDDGSTGIAQQYDLRYSTATITAANFNSASQVANEPPPVTAGSQQTITVSGLAENTTYYFAIKTADEVPNWSGLSNIATGATANGAPTAPTPVTPVSGDTLLEGSSIVLTVANAADPDGDPLWYSFWIASDAAFTNVVTSYANKPQTSSQTSVTLSSASLAPGQTYYWRCRATDGSAFSNYTSASWFAYVSLSTSTGCDRPIAAPTPISPISGVASATAQPVFWVHNSPDTTDCEAQRTYTIQIFEDSELSSLIRSAVVNEGADSTSYTYTGSLQTGRFYYWRARCSNGTVESPYSSVQYFHTPNTAPLAPVLVTPADSDTVTVQTPTLTALTSSDPDGAVTLRYRFEISVSSAFTTRDSSTLVGASGGTAVWQVEDNLTGGALYYWRVRTFDGIDYSAYSATRSFVVNLGGNTAPTAPTPASPADFAVVTTARPPMTVDNGGDADGDPLTYQFQLYDDQAGLLIAQASDIAEGDSQTSWTPTDSLADSTIFRWRARVFDGTAYSSWTSYRRFTVNLPVEQGNSAPSLPVHLSPENGGTVIGLPIVLEIQNSVDLDGDDLTYDFWVYSDMSLTQLVESHLEVTEEIGGSTTVTLDLEPISDKQYFWRCRANDGHNTGDVTNATSFVYSSLSTGQEDYTPGAATPPPGAAVPNDRPELRARNIAAGGEGNLYYFEVASDSEFVAVICQSAPVPEQDGDYTCWHIDEALPVNGTFYWHVRANNNPYSPTSSFIITADVKAWPNPVRFSEGEVVTFNLPEDQPVDLLIQTLSGETVLLITGATGDTEWDGRNESGNMVSVGAYLWYAANTGSHGKIVVKP